MTPRDSPPWSATIQANYADLVPKEFHPDKSVKVWLKKCNCLKMKNGWKLRSRGTEEDLWKDDVQFKPRMQGSTWPSQRKPRRRKDQCHHTRFKHQSNDCTRVARSRLRNHAKAGKLLSRNQSRRRERTSRQRNQTRLETTLIQNIKTNSSGRTNKDCSIDSKLADK